MIKKSKHKKISAVVCVYNEEKHIIPLVKNLRDFDEIIIADGGSTDKTVELARNCKNVNVIIRENIVDTPTEEQISAFKSKFGFDSNLQTTDRLMNFGEIRNRILDMAEHDWVYYPDADERITWDQKAVRRLMENWEQIECVLVQSREPYEYNHIVKFFDRTKARWVGRNHEVIFGNNDRIVHSTKMKIDHYRDSNGKGGLPLIKNLEYSVITEGRARDMFYLAREYCVKSNYDFALAILHEHEKIGTWKYENAEVCYLKAGCYWMLKDKNKSMKCCMDALAINPEMKKVYVVLRDMSTGMQRQYWQEMADNATNQWVVFP